MRTSFFSLLNRKATHHLFRNLHTTTPSHAKWPKKLIACFLLLLSAASGLQAQCGTNTQLGGQAGCTRSSFYRGEGLPNAGCGVNTAITNYSPGEYFRVPVLQGGCYSVSTCGAPFDTHINVFQGNNTSGPFAYNDDNGPECTGTNASVVMTPNFTDYAMVDVRQYPCMAGGSSSITVYLRQNNNLSITSSNANMCEGQTRPLTAVPARVTVTPQPNSGDVGTFSGTGVSGTNFTAPVPPANSGAYNVNYTFGFCSTTQSITVFHTPSTANAGSDQTLCAGTATLAANTPSFGTGAWSIVSGPGSVTTPSSPTSGVTGLLAGVPTTLRWTISNGPCASSSDDVVLTVNATAPSITCPGPQQLILNSSCQASLPNYTSLATVSGACSPVVTQSPAIGSTQSGVGALTVSLFATNSVPQSNTCTFTVNKVAPEMNVKGNNVSIVDGDASPSLADFTDLGQVIFGNNLDKTFKIFNTGGAPLSITTPLTITGSGFSVFTQPATTVAAGDSTAFVVRFSPSGLGVVNGTLSITNTDCDENPYDYAIRAEELATTRWYVDHTATGANNGTSWLNASPISRAPWPSLMRVTPSSSPRAHEEPKYGACPVEEIHPRGGRALMAASPMAGGTFAWRDFSANRTILSGDIGTKAIAPTTASSWWMPAT
ncbi:MAG: choice-of-anchor D domain-containing protein [Bacteroidia bacterium]